MQAAVVSISAIARAVGKTQEVQAVPTEVQHQLICTCRPLRPMFAAVSMDGKRRRGKPVSGEEREELLTMLEQADPKELEELERLAKYRLAQSKRVTVDGKRVSCHKVTLLQPRPAVSRYS